MEYVWQYVSIFSEVLFEAEIMDKHKNLNNFEKGWILMARQLGKSNSKTASPVRFSLQPSDYTKSGLRKENC